jgi:HPt (histidine-containing phosphotransfer) domain-containing protein
MGGKKYNLNYLNEISGGDKAFILDMIQTFVNNAPEEIEELKKLASESQWNILGEKAHKFAPSLQFLGISVLKPVINQIEELSFANKHVETIMALVEKLESHCYLVLQELKIDFNL